MGNRISDSWLATGVIPQVGTALAFGVFLSASSAAAVAAAEAGAASAEACGLSWWSATTLVPKLRKILWRFPTVMARNTSYKY